MILQIITIAIMIFSINNFNAKLDKIKVKEVRIIENTIPILPDTMIHKIPYFTPKIVPIDSPKYIIPWPKNMEVQDSINLKVRKIIGNCDIADSSNIKIKSKIGYNESHLEMIERVE